MISNLIFYYFTKYIIILFVKFLEKIKKLQLKRSFQNVQK